MIIRDQPMIIDWGGGGEDLEGGRGSHGFQRERRGGPVVANRV